MFPVALCHSTTASFNKSRSGRETTTLPGLATGSVRQHVIMCVR